MPSGSVGSVPILAARNIHKTYKLGRVDVPVLKGVDLDVREGEFLAILGASGSGKSTLLHILGGLDRPDRYAGGPVTRCLSCTYPRVVAKSEWTNCPECGKPFGSKGEGGVIFRGRDLALLSAGELDRYRSHEVGFVFQFYHLLPELSVTENVTISMMVHGGRGARERTKAAEEMLRVVGLSHRLRHRPAELSGGERQRVAIARALVNQPKVLLADEPTGNLDRETGRKILDTFAEIRADRKHTMVIVTHDPATAERADRVVVIEDGRLAEDQDWRKRQAHMPPRG
jgi:ABC-type lipoprotein export system ATPase subunit